MIVYGASANESVPRLYAAGVIPGLLIALLLAAYVVLYARRRSFDAGTPLDIAALLRALAGATLVALAVLVPAGLLAAAAWPAYRLWLRRRRERALEM